MFDLSFVAILYCVFVWVVSNVLVLVVCCACVSGVFVLVVCISGWCVCVGSMLV